MTLLEFMEQIWKTKRYIGSELTKEEIKLAKDNHFIIIFGYSDDCAELRGFIEDEVDCFDGGTVFKKSNAYVDAVWYSNNIPWTYSTNIPHEIFDIYDDYEKTLYCKAIVFDINDITE